MTAVTSDMTIVHPSRTKTVCATSVYTTCDEDMMVWKAKTISWSTWHTALSPLSALEAICNFVHAAGCLKQCLGAAANHAHLPEVYCHAA